MINLVCVQLPKANLQIEKTNIWYYDKHFLWFYLSTRQPYLQNKYHITYITIFIYLFSDKFVNM